MSPPREGADRRLLVGLGLAVVGLLWLFVGLAFFPGGEAWGYDYRAYADAAERLAQTGSLYQAETLAGPYRPGPYGLYMYAPPLGIAIGPLASVESDTAVVLWFVLHGVALAAACDGQYQQAARLQQQVIGMVKWMLPAEKLQPLETTLAAYEKDSMPQQPVWPADDPLLSPLPLNPVEPFRDYPAAVPF